ncbi:MAG: dihydrofolate reductase [Candidatus Ancillula sp.]|jgi:dihydrofolate reductase|nr:dihydrofolate reductase [Candidatus Ancillula sp.]
MTISVIWAQDRNRGIGKNNTIPWHISGDFKNFKQQTLGKTVIMGRKTWESLPEKSRPLPGRKNIVLTRDPEKLDTDPKFSGAELKTLDSLDTDYLKNSEDEVFVIGGSSIFSEFIPLAKRLVITEIDENFHCDVFAPDFLDYISNGCWRKLEQIPWSEDKGIRWRVLEYYKV